MKRTKWLLILIAMQMFPFFGLAQDNGIDEISPPKNIISVDIARLCFHQTRISYERLISNRFGLMASGGILFSSTDYYENYGLFQFTPKYGEIFDGYYSALGCSYYLTEEEGFYTGVELSYFHKYFDNKLYYDLHGMDSQSFVFLQNMDRHKFAAKLYVGKRYVFTTKKWVSLAIDFSIAGGLQYRVDNVQTIGRSYGHTSFDFSYYYVYAAPSPRVKTMYLPVVEFNLKASVPFKLTK